jgi:hypothetical protein
VTLARPPALASEGWLPTKRPGYRGRRAHWGRPRIPQFHLPAAAAKGVYTPKALWRCPDSFRRPQAQDRRNPAGGIPGAAWTPWRARSIGTLRSRPIRNPDQYAENRRCRPTLPATAGWGDGYQDLHAMGQRASTAGWLARSDWRCRRAPDTPDETSIGPKRGGVSVELVAIAWDLV